VGIVSSLSEPEIRGEELMKSKNFEFLRPSFPELADLGGFAERYSFADPSSALVKLRMFAETMVSAIYSYHKLPRPYQFNLNDMLNDEMFVSTTPKTVRYKLHELRVQGNKAAHGVEAVVKPQIPAWLLQEAYDLACWFFLSFCGGSKDACPPFAEVKPVTEAEAESKKADTSRQLAERKRGWPKSSQSLRRLAPKLRQQRKRRVSFSSFLIRPSRRPMSCNSMRPLPAADSLIRC
jgi:type I restriction enzyme R subunit